MVENVNRTIITINGFMKWNVWNVAIDITLMDQMFGLESVLLVKRLNKQSILN